MHRKIGKPRIRPIGALSSFYLPSLAPFVPQLTVRRQVANAEVMNCSLKNARMIIVVQERRINTAAQCKIRILGKVFSYR